MSTIRERIDSIKYTFHISQAEFSRRIGVTPQLVSQVVNEKIPLSYLTAKAIESEFGVAHEWLMSGEGEMMAAKPPAIKNVNLAPELITALGYYPAITEELNRLAKRMTLPDWEALNTFLTREKAEPPEEAPDAENAP